MSGQGSPIQFQGQNSTDTLTALVDQLDRRVQFFHETLNERLAVKDRWIRDQFDGERAWAMTKIGDVEASIQVEREHVRERTAQAITNAEAAHVAIAQRIDAVAMKQKDDDQSLREWLMARFDLLEKTAEANKEAQRRQGELVIAGHMDMHRATERNFDEFKGSVQQRLDVLSKAIDTLREERGLFVLRDSHDAQVDALEKLIDSLERSVGEKLDNAIKQTREGFDARITTNTDRITKMDQNMQVMNARNQQSIIALGILLTLVEIIIRFYQ